MSSNISLLLIEDDEVDQMAFVGLLKAQQLRYRFHLAASIAEARRILASTKFDIVIADYNLPDGTAFDILDEILKNPVIIATGGGDEETAVRALRLGVSDYIIKDPERNYIKLLPLRIDSVLRQWNAATALRESEERLRDLFENATDLIQTVGRDGKIQFVNRAWLETLGYSEAEAIGMGIFEIVHPDDLKHCIEAFSAVLDGKSVTGIQTVFRARDGRSVHVEGNVNCRFENGVPVSTRGIFHDITERIRHDEEREKLIAELQKALDDVKTLSGLLPICAWCNKVRDDSGYWQDVESFLQANARLTHGLCPHCAPKVFAEFEKSPASAIET